MDEQDALIKTQLDVHIDTVTSEILVDDDYFYSSRVDQQMTSIDADDFGWHDHDHDDDEQLHIFRRFVAISSNFATLPFASKLHALPDLVKRIKELLAAMRREIRQFADIAGHFEELAQAFVELVMSTRHNMSMALPHLGQSVTQMEIVREALMPDSPLKPLSAEDTSDIHWALTNMAYGAEKMLAHSSSSEELGQQMHTRIAKLNSHIRTKLRVVGGRIMFSNLVPVLGSGLVVGSLSSGTIAAIESSALGGTGALVLGGLAFPPLGALIAAAVVGGLAVGSVFSLIVKLWQMHQFKALDYLQLILADLSKLSQANVSFMGHMRRSKENMNTLLSSVTMLRTTIGQPSARQRRSYAKTCDQAISSTKAMIDCIKMLEHIDLQELVDDCNSRHVLSSENVLSDTQLSLRLPITC